MAKIKPGRFVASETSVSSDLLEGTEQIQWYYILCYSASVIIPLAVILETKLAID